jgi:hypothetical protein
MMAITQGRETVEMEFVRNVYKYADDLWLSWQDGCVEDIIYLDKIKRDV